MRAVFGIVLLAAAVLPSAGNAQTRYRSVTSVNAEWRKLPPAMAQCVRSELRRHGLDISQLVQQGVLPSDPRLERLMSECSDASFDNAESPYQQRRPGNVFSDTHQSLPNAPNSIQQPVERSTPPQTIPSQQQSRQADQGPRIVDERKVAGNDATPSPANQEYGFFSNWTFGGLLIGLLAVWAIIMARTLWVRDENKPSVSLPLRLKQLTLADWSSAAMVFAFAAALPLAKLAMGSSVTAVRSVGLLLVPSALFFWNVVTIKALHRMEKRFWLMRSTWVMLIFGIITFLIFWAGYGLNQLFQPKDGHFDYTLTIAGIVVLAAAAIWSFRYNWLATRNLSLSLSLLALQLVSSLGIIAAISSIFATRTDGKNRQQQLS